MSEKLYKSKHNRVIAGVCGGIAEYFNVDATLIRLAWVLAVFFAGTGLIIYILAMIIMPEESVYVEKPNTTAVNTLSDNECSTEEKSGRISDVQATSAKEDDTKRHQVLGLILVGLGGYFLFERFFPYFRLHNWWPLILIFIGVAILLKSIGGKGQ